MADVKTISGVFTGHMLNILLLKSQFRFGLGIMSWQDTEQELLWRFLVEMKRLCFANFFGTRWNAGNQKFFLMLIFPKSLRF
jgi:hypothetical protein